MSTSRIEIDIKPHNEIVTSSLPIFHFLDMTGERSISMESQLRNPETERG